jgi:hypothetical protein
VAQQPCQGNRALHRPQPGDFIGTLNFFGLVLEKFTPVNPGEAGLFTLAGKIAQKGFDFFPSGFLMEKAQQGEAIEDYRRIHVFSPYDALPGGRRSVKNPPG